MKNSAQKSSGDEIRSNLSYFKRKIHTFHAPYLFFYQSSFALKCSCRYLSKIWILSLRTQQPYFVFIQPINFTSKKMRKFDENLRPRKKPRGKLEILCKFLIAILLVWGVCVFSVFFLDIPGQGGSGKTLFWSLTKNYDFLNFNSDDFCDSFYIAPDQPENKLYPYSNSFNISAPIENSFKSFLEFFLPNLEVFFFFLKSSETGQAAEVPMLLINTEC